MFTTGLVVYTLSAIAAAFVTTVFALIALRSVQGCVSLFTTTGMAILTSIFPAGAARPGARHLRGRGVRGPVDGPLSAAN